MLTLVLLATLAAPRAVQAPAPNTACTILTAQDVTALVGAGAHTLPVSAAPNGASCMFQNGDKMVTVLTSKQQSPDNAGALFSSKKAVAAGTDITGWPAKAYAGSMGDTAVVGITKGAMFVEVKVIDSSRKAAAIMTPLKTVMQGVAGRL
jgi:hypothetical protein